MPYDHAKTSEMLKISQAYASHPLGEYLSRLATQLVDAEAEMKALVKSLGDVRLEQQESERRLIAEAQAHTTTKGTFSETIRVLSEQNGMLIAALNAISADSRGSKKIAQDALEKLQPVAP